MVRFLSFIFLALIFSCSIIEDSDITSQKELDNLKFKSIEIKQQTNSGNSTVVARVTTDSVINISVPAGILNRTLWMDWPALGSKKMKLRSGFTAAFKSYTSFLESGKPWTFYLFDNDTTVFEIYRFRYDVSGRLSNIITNVGGPATNDTLIYGNPDNESEVTSIIRRSTDTSKAGTFSITAGSLYNLQSFNFKGTTYQKPNSNESSFYSYGATFPPNDGLLEVTDFQKQSLSLIDRNNVSGNCRCNVWIDAFYFHPLMILKDQLVYEDQYEMRELGNALLFIYMVDWWQPVSTQESTKDESVTFNFKYGL